MVVLPTGLGKTLIAAVVMYNYFRWFPEGKFILYIGLCLRGSFIEKSMNAKFPWVNVKIIKLLYTNRT